MDFNTFVPQSQAYPYFVPAQGAQQYSPPEDQYEPLDAFPDPNNLHFFDQNTQTHFQPSSVIPPSQSPPLSVHRQSMSRTLGHHDSSGSVTTDMNADIDFSQEQRGSSDEEKEFPTPAKSRRKAQNRAAQRAFRERKEQHVKNLELKLKSLEAKSTDLLSDNERLKRELDKVATQYEILRATSTPMHLTKKGDGQVPDGMDSDETGPIAYSPRTFSHAVTEHFPEGPEVPVSHRVSQNAVTGEKLLATGAAWDYIQQHELHRRGLVELGDVVDHLKRKVQCNGSGPTFSESAVEEAIQDSIGIGGDELI